MRSGLRLATAWTVWGSNPAGGNFSHLFRPALKLTQTAIYIPGGKADGVLALPTHTHLAPKLKKE